jgi:hypothetical protein
MRLARRRRLFDTRRAPLTRAAEPRAGAPPRGTLAWFGAASPRWAAARPRRSLRALALAGGVAAALGIVTLRTEILRARQSLAERVAEEERLRGVRDELRVALRRLRHPDRLAALARERGFGPPERVLDLAPPREKP